MAKSAKQLMEERAPLIQKIREMSDLLQVEHRDFSAEEKANWETLNTDYNLITGQIDAATAVERLAPDGESLPEAREVVGRSNIIHRPDELPSEPEQRVADHDVLTALQGWCRVSAEMELEARHLRAAKLLGQNLRSQFFTISLRSDYPVMRRELRIQTGVVDTAGGFLRPEGFVNQIERALLQFGGVRQVAAVMRTGDGNDMPWPTTDDTSNEGVLIGESLPATAPEQDVAFGQTVLRAHLYSSDLVRVSNSLLEDSAFPLGTLLPDILGERLGRITSRHYTTGMGGGQPQGVATASTLGVTSAAAAAIAFDEVIDLIHSIDPAYRPMSSFMMHDGIIQYVRKLKDGNGQYLWQPSNQIGVPDRILGYPIQVNQHMQATVATGTKTILFGDFSKYKIRDVNNIRFKRLEERYGELDQVGFVAFFRTDGALLDAGTHPVKHLLQA